MRIDLNVILNTINDDEEQEANIIRQVYININESIQKNTQRIMFSLKSFKPVMLEVLVDSSNLKDIDKEKKFFQNSKFTTDMVIDVL